MLTDPKIDLISQRAKIDTYEAFDFPGYEPLR